jgi:hypothetical protein
MGQWETLTSTGQTVPSLARCRVSKRSLPVATTLAMWAAVSPGPSRASRAQTGIARISSRE